MQPCMVSSQKVSFYGRFVPNSFLLGLVIKRLPTNEFSLHFPFQFFPLLDKLLFISFSTFSPIPLVHSSFLPFLSSPLPLFFSRYSSLSSLPPFCSFHPFLVLVHSIPFSLSSFLPYGSAKSSATNLCIHEEVPRECHLPLSMK